MTSSENLKKAWIDFLVCQRKADKTKRKVYTLANKMTQAELEELWETTLRKPTERHYKDHDDAFKKFTNGDVLWKAYARRDKRYLLEHAKDFKGKGILKKNRIPKEIKHEVETPAHAFAGKSVEELTDLFANILSFNRNYIDEIEEAFAAALERMRRDGKS